MSVKKKDRHISRREALGKSRELVNYILVLTRPREFSEDGKQVKKPGMLGEGQPLQAFGYDLLRCGKGIHANCYQASKIYLKRGDEDSLKERNKYHKFAIEYCDSIFRQIDLCIYQYAKGNKKKMKSFNHLALLTKITKSSIQNRMNRDNLIFMNKDKKEIAYRRGR